MSILPSSCASCGMNLEWSSTGVDLYCHNINCEAKNGRQLTHFFSMLNNLDGFGPKTIETLIENGFDTIPKIYAMSYSDFQKCGYKTKTIMNLGSELELSKTRDLPDYRFIAALGIPDLGISGAKKLLEHFSWDKILFDIIPFDILEVDGFSNTKAFSIFNFVRCNSDIEKIKDIGFNIVHEEIEVSESTITGKRICFTGKMESNRTDMQNIAKGLGGIPVGSVNSKTDILVCGSCVGANKTNAAEKYNTEVLTEKEFFDLVKE